MRNVILLLSICLVFLHFTGMVNADQSLLCQGRWGSEVNELGINFPSPGVMPIAPYACIGGFDVDNSGAIWFSDSINNKIKCYKNKKWSYIMANYGKMGDLACYGKKIFVVTRQPDGVAVINPENGKVERHWRLAFKNPGRLKIFNENLIAVEESGSGLWISKNDKPYLHPAAALEAIGHGNRIFGLQFNFAADSRTIISAELADEIQEPDVFTVYEPADKIVFSKTAGMKGDKPVIMIVTSLKPQILQFITLSNEGPTGTIELNLLEGPFLPSSWKICSDGNIYGFAGDAKEGFKFFKAEKNL